MLLTKKALSASAMTALCSLASAQPSVATLATGAAGESWAVSNFAASYIYENNQTASINFDLTTTATSQNLTEQQQQHHCCIVVPDTEITHLPNITGVGCEGSDGEYLFDFTLEMLLPGLPIGADLAVYRRLDLLHGTHHFTDRDFTLYPVGGEQMDIKYVGPTEFAVAINGK